MYKSMLCNTQSTDNFRKNSYTEMFLIRVSRPMPNSVHLVCDTDLSGNQETEKKIFSFAPSLIKTTAEFKGKHLEKPTFVAMIYHVRWTQIFILETGKGNAIIEKFDAENYLLTHALRKTLQGLNIFIVFNHRLWIFIQTKRFAANTVK